MRNKLIVILLDGCTREGTKALGYLESLKESGACSRFDVMGELPSLSRPMYETIFTGLPVRKHGIVHNGVIRRSSFMSVFDLCKKAGYHTTMAAYYWMYELFCEARFHYENIMIDNDTETINHGFFYFEDAFPDNHVYAMAEALIERYHDDLVVIHPMNIDDQGHKFGKDSREYLAAIGKNDAYISEMIMRHQEEYDFMIFSDHGMNEKGLHGGNTAEERQSFLYVLKEHFNAQEHLLTTCQLANLMCQLLGIESDENMEECGVVFDER